MAWYDDLWDSVSDAYSDAVAASIGFVVDAAEWIFGNAEKVGKEVDRVTQGYKDAAELALQGPMDWIVEQILALTEQIRVWKYRFRQAVAKWLDNPILFWLSVAGIAALVVYLPAIAKLIVNTNAFKFGATLFAAIKSSVGTLLEKIGYIQVIQVNKILLIINPDYQKFWSDLDEAFMGLAEEIEIGVGTFNNLNMSIRDLYYSTYTLLGIDQDTIEMRFYEDSTKFWQGAQDRWERYVRDPKLIFDDIQKELVYPILSEKAQFGIDRAKNDLLVAERIDTTIVNLDSFRTSVNAVFDAMPSFVHEAIDEKIGEVLSSIDQFFEDKLLPWREKLDASITSVALTIQEMESAIFSNSVRTHSVSDDLVSILFDGSLNIKEKRDAISLLMSKILEPDFTRANDRDLLFIALNEKSNDDFPVYNVKSEPDKYVPLFSISLDAIKASSEGWFVGEY